MMVRGCLVQLHLLMCPGHSEELSLLISLQAEDEFIFIFDIRNYF